MRQEQSHILDAAGTDPGFRVPEGYFDDFAGRMAASLPHVEITDTARKPTLWQVARPYVYLAAMFAGVWCMMKVTGVFHHNISAEQRVSEVATMMHIDNNADEFIMSGCASDYDIMTYEDSLQADAELP